MQLFALPYHGQFTKITRSGYAGSVGNVLLIYTMLVGVPLVVGFILLGISVATLNNQASGVDPGSRMAIQASGYIPVAILGYFAVTIVVTTLGVLITHLQSIRSDAKEFHSVDMKLPISILYPLHEKLHFLPGGPGYINYRRKHMTRDK
jgi:hypothetical protein